MAIVRFALSHLDNNKSTRVVLRSALKHSGLRYCERHHLLTSSIEMELIIKKKKKIVELFLFSQELYNQFYSNIDFVTNR